MSEDRSAIEVLLADYADRIDDGDFAGVGALFARGCIVDADGNVLATGADEVEALYAATTKRYPEGTPRTHHAVTNVVISFDGDRADARSRFTVHQAVEPGALRPVITGDYTDRFERDQDGWRFAERRMGLRLAGELGDHLLIDLPPAGSP